MNEHIKQVDGKRIYDIVAYGRERGHDVARLPVSLRLLLENLLRYEASPAASPAHIDAVLNWDPRAAPSQEIAFHPARVVLQDFTGVPAVVDLAAMRDALAELGGSADAINPLFPSELVIDHSVQVDSFGHPDSLTLNTRREYERNQERYQLLRWAQGTFSNFQVVPPSTGIVHQVNLEYLARVVFDVDGTLYPDTLVGTDSHTTMINGIGVLGWGVGGIEAEAAMLGQPINLLLPQVVGVRLTGRPHPGTTATDIVLTLTRLLRKQGVVGKFVEFFGDGLAHVPLETRATIANMSPEFGSTCALFPVDEATIAYLAFSGRPAEQCARVESYFRAQGLFRAPDTVAPQYSVVLEFDLGSARATISGPKRPQDSIALDQAKSAWRKTLRTLLGRPDAPDLPSNPQPLAFDNWQGTLDHGSVVIAAITSCTNTSNPHVMVGAGLLAQAAVERGLSQAPWVKTSLAPGSKVVTRYLGKAGLLEPLAALGFDLVGYGCTTCIGNSGPLPEPVSAAVHAGDLVVTSVLSGNRNFEGRINPDVRASYLASPPLVVAYALAGRMDIDFETDPLGTDKDGNEVFLRDIWPAPGDIAATIASSVSAAAFTEEYASVFEGDAAWQDLDTPTGKRFEWAPSSTYVKRPPFLEAMPREPRPLEDISGARVLLKLGDSVTTDHISPAGSIPTDSAAGKYLIAQGVSPRDFNSYGSRRGNHEVMMRGTFANVRIRNQLTPNAEGAFSLHVPSGEVDSVYEVAMRYQVEGTPLVVLAGKEYGSGSSRDWAAKGTALLGVRAVISESYERIHRSNLVGMGVLPLQFPEGQSASSLGLSGEEEFSFTGIASALTPGGQVHVVARRVDGAVEFDARVRIDTPIELDYYRSGGILQYVMRQLAARGADGAGHV